MPASNDPLTAAQRAALRAALAPFAEVIDRVDVFGSRARGDHRPGSDLDLILHGRLDRDMLARIGAALDESDLSISVDLHCIETLEDERLRAIAMRDARPLLGKAELANDA